MGTRWNRLAEAVLTSIHKICFEQKYEKYLNILSKNFHFFVVKFSVYLNRRVFVMWLIWILTVCIYHEDTFSHVAAQHICVILN